MTIITEPFIGKTIPSPFNSTVPLKKRIDHIYTVLFLDSVLCVTNLYCLTFHNYHHSIVCYCSLIGFEIRECASSKFVSYNSSFAFSYIRIHLSICRKLSDGIFIGMALILHFGGNFYNTESFPWCVHGYQNLYIHSCRTC